MLDPQPLDPDELVIVLIGASAVGKSACAEFLTETGVVEATPTWATRQPREGEQSTCYDHRFVSEEVFDGMSREGGFIDEHTLYGARYGVPVLGKPAEGKEALVVLKPIFMPKFVAHYPRTRIYQIDASKEVVPLRMSARGQSPQDIEERVRHHDKEAADAHRFAHVTFNNDGPLEETLLRVKHQIRRDREAYDARAARRA
jgi:guanylate kinase